MERLRNKCASFDGDLAGKFFSIVEIPEEDRK
jgi:hypothetical protein